MPKASDDKPGAVTRLALEAVREAIATKGIQGTVRVTDVPGEKGGIDTRRFEVLDAKGIPMRTITIAADAQPWELALVARALPAARENKIAILAELSNSTATNLDELRPGLAVQAALRSR